MPEEMPELFEMLLHTSTISDSFKKVAKKDDIYKKEEFPAPMLDGILRGSLVPMTDPSGRYHSLSRISVGDQGVIHRAVDRETGTFCAVKSVHTTDLDDHRRVRRFMREIDLLSGFDHPHVIGVHDELDLTFSGTPIPSFVMPYVHGGDLFTMLQGKKIDPAVLGKVVRQIAKALDYSHQRGVVHRDVKCENVVVSKEGDAKLVDYGIARSSSGRFGEVPDGREVQYVRKSEHVHRLGKLTQVGWITGTLEYIAPEVLSGRSEHSPASDLYALGVILYKGLSGKFPFDDEDKSQIPQKIVSQDPPPLNGNPLANVALCLLEKNPHARYQSGEEVCAAIDAALR